MEQNTPWCLWKHLLTDSWIEMDVRVDKGIKAWVLEIQVDQWWEAEVACRLHTPRRQPATSEEEAAHAVEETAAALEE